MIHTLRWLAIGALAGTGLAVGVQRLVETMLRYGIPLGPFATLLAWLALWCACALRSRPCPFADAVSWYELAPAVIAAMFVELLLDMRTPYLGDVIVAGVHAIALIVLVAIARARR